MSQSLPPQPPATPEAPPPDQHRSVNLDHPTFALVKAAFPGKGFLGAEFRGQSTLIVAPGDLHAVMAFLRRDPACAYEFLSDVLGIDYLGYPAKMPGRFAVVYNLVSCTHERRFFVKVFLDPSLPTAGTEPDPALEVDSVTDIWPGAEWNEREVFDMFGVRFRGHPDLRRILTWEAYPAHPLRKDYPLRGRGEREAYKVVDRTDA
jgi:NADH-quinone oxidoreductase subunit C